MNAPQPTSPAITELVEAIAAADDALSLSGSEVNAVDIIFALQPLMPPTLWAPIAEQWEICPEHVCDEAICRDDEADCEAARR